MVFPSSSDPVFEAFLVGFALPFLAACGGWAIGLIRHLVSLFDRDSL
jgi:hypothetical protein